ncbi:MAG: MnhB domain-containing protein [Verrucomicrobiae bacterium]|nr:MnhB domain-containing protein [Verrucomicrobiae bacterium]
MNPSRSMIFGLVAKALFFVLHILAVYLLLRGHNLPGGGFIGGLVSAIAFIMLSLALGWREMEQVIRVDAARVAFVGLFLTGLTALGPMVVGRPPLEQFMWHLELPWFGEWHVGTTLAFDAGVFLVVVGVSVKMIVVLGRSSEGMHPFGPREDGHYAAAVEEAIDELGRDPLAARKEGDDAG